MKGSGGAAGMVLGVEGLGLQHPGVDRMIFDIFPIFPTLYKIEWL